MIRWKPNAVASVMLARPVSGMMPVLMLTLMLTVVLYPPSPSAMAPTSHPEQRIAPIYGEDWPVLENPDGDEIMIVGLRPRHDRPTA